MKKFTLSLIAGLLSLCCAPFAQATDVPAGETDITTLPWVNNGQGCDNKLGTKTGDPIWGTDAGVANLSYVDLSDYGELKLYGPAEQRVRLFLNRAEFGDNGIFYVDIDGDGVGTFDFNTVLEQQPRAQFIHLNGVKAAAWGQEAQIDMITVSGTAITFPEIKTLPEGETDITTLPWVNQGQGCANNLGTETGDTNFGTDAGPNGDQLSYVNITNFGKLKIYGQAGDVVRLFINRAEYSSNFEFFVTIEEEGVGVFDIASVYTTQVGAEYVHLNGVKCAATWQGGSGKAKVDLIGLTEKPFTCPDDETDIITLPWVNEGQGCVTDNFDVDTDATIWGTDAGPTDGQLSYVDVTKYGAVKIYGHATDVVRFFINRAEFSDWQFSVTINDDGYAVLDFADVYAKQPGATYIHINGVKALQSWAGGTTGRAKVKGITLLEKKLFTIHHDETLTDEHGVNHIAKNGDDVWAANSINLDESCEYKLDMDVLAAEVNYLREVTSNRWSTICLPFAVPSSALTGYDVLKLKGIEGVAVVFEYLDETEGMDDHTPYLIKTDDNKLAFNLTGEVTIKASDDAIANGTGVQLVGIYKAQRVPEGCYALAGGEFHKAAATNENELKPYRAYLQTVSSKQMLKVAINGATSAIEGIEVAEDAQDGVFYNLKGQKVNNPTNGVYILNGVKVIVK